MTATGALAATIQFRTERSFAQLLWHLATARDPVLMHGRQGNWRWPRALGSTVAAIIFIIILQALIIGFTAFFNVKVGADEVVLDPEQPFSFLLVFFIFLPFIIVPSLLMRYLQRVSWRAVIAPSGRFDWQLYRRAAGGFFAVAAILLAIDYPINASTYQLIPRGANYLPWLALGLAVIFVQTLAEEILFRGYLLRIWGAVVPFRLLTTSAVMTLFISLHLPNPDIKIDLWFSLIGFALNQGLWCYVWFRTQSVAATAGLHWANNVMVFFIVATVPGQSTSMALASLTDPVLARGGSHLLDPYAWFMMLLGICLTAVLLVWRRSPFFVPIRSCATSQEIEKPVLPQGLRIVPEALIVVPQGTPGSEIYSTVKSVAGPARSKVVFGKCSRADKGLAC